jgi:hypothetical protein
MCLLCVLTACDAERADDGLCRTINPFMHLLIHQMLFAYFMYFDLICLILTDFLCLPAKEEKRFVASNQN